MRHLARGCTLLLFSAIWLSAIGLATAGEPTDVVRQITDQVLAILEDPQFQAPNRQAERQERLHKIAEQVFDWQEMARRALAVHWRQRTPQEQQEFVKLFRDLVEGTYINRLENAIQEKREIQYVGEHQQVPIEYRLHQVDGRWLIYDVLVEGISLVNNYRSQFNRIITSSSYDDLVQKMRARQGDELSGSPERRVQ